MWSLCCIVFIRWGICSLGSAALAELIVGLFAVYPGFHIGLRPHSTLGYVGVSPFQGSLSDCLLFPQGFISGFALISPWALRECRPCRALCRIGRLWCCVVVLCSLNVFGVCKWIVAVGRVFV